MDRKVVVAAIVATAAMLIAGTVAADERDSRAGTKGHVTAWSMDKQTVIDVDPCPKAGKYTWSYTTCGSRFRAKVNEAMCRTKGEGNHEWLYQVGSSSVYTHQTARCE